MAATNPGDGSRAHRPYLESRRTTFVSRPSSQGLKPVSRLRGTAPDKRFEERFGYDPVKAKALLAQAGYPQGFAFTLYLYTLPGLPEILDIGQAMALDFQAIGLKPKLVETEFTRVRELYRTRMIHGALFPTRHAGQALDVARNVHKAKDSGSYWYEHPVIEERLEALTTVVDKAERTRLLREIGDHKVDEFGFSGISRSTKLL